MAIPCHVKSRMGYNLRINQLCPQVGYEANFSPRGSAALWASGTRREIESRPWLLEGGGWGLVLPITAYMVRLRPKGGRKRVGIS